MLEARAKGGPELRPLQPDSDRSQQQDDGIFVKSYLYLRLAIVALLTALGVAVAYETVRLKFHPLSSVSAYYYSPAQAIFVGALIGFAACMIALKGTTDLEDVVLNIGGMFAAVVAIVPTSRGADFDAAVAACQKAGPLGGSDCPSRIALVDAAKLNIENNVSALLLVGALAVLIAILFAIIKGPAFSWKAFGAGVSVLVLVGAPFIMSREWFINNAHWLAAAGLFICIFIVALENARRQKAKLSNAPSAGADGAATAGPAAGQAVGVLISGTGGREHYTWIARIMLVVGGFAVWVWTSHWISLFLLEIIVFALFIAFWIAQTIEQGSQPPGSEHIMENTGSQGYSDAR